MKSMSKTVAVMLGVLVLGVSGMPAYALAEEKEPAIVIQEPDGTKAELPPANSKEPPSFFIKER